MESNVVTRDTLVSRMFLQRGLMKKKLFHKLILRSHLKLKLLFSLLLRNMNLTAKMFLVYTLCYMPSVSCSSPSLSIPIPYRLFLELITCPWH